MAARDQKVTIPRPKAFAKTVSLFSSSQSPAGVPKSAKKTVLQDDPGKFGNFGFNILGVNPIGKAKTK